MIRKLILSLTLILLYQLPLSADPKSILIKGIVLDKQTNEPIIGATVAIHNTSLGVTTDTEGRFKLSIPSQQQELVIHLLGYKNEIVVVNTTTNHTDLQIFLSSDTQMLESVVVEGKSPVQQIRETAFNVTAVEAKKLHNLSSDINQVLNRTTGVRVRSNGGTGSDFTFSLNGFSGNQLKFFLDGVPIDNYGPAFNLKNIPINLAERIEVYKGVVPVSLGGDALGGAINIVTKKNMKQHVDASYTVGSFNTHKLSISSRYVTDKDIVFNLNAFGNYSDNSYKVTVEDIDKNGTGKYLEPRRYKRFHDGYKSGTVILEAGVQNKSYADHLLIGLSITGNKDEVQQGPTMSKVVGQAYKDNTGLIPTLKYKKSNLLTENLNLDFTSTYTLATNNTVDTCARVYSWDGSYSFRASADPGAGELGEKQWYEYKEKNLITTTNLSYTFAEHHTLLFNHMLNDYYRDEKDKYKERKSLGKPQMRKNSVGLSYTLKLLNNKLSLSAFSKYHDLYTKLIVKETETSLSQNSWGYGSAAAYEIFPFLQAKASYEYAYRMPTFFELLGDGITVRSNLELKPEKSDNFNFGLLFNQSLGSMHSLGIESNFVYRNAKDFIKNKPYGNATMYRNEDQIKVVGLDGVVRYTYSDWFQLETNVTWQKTTNNKKYEDTGLKNGLYGDQMPNTPMVFGNADASFNKRNLFQKEDNVTLSVNFNYVGSFYLNWPSLGEKESKKSIPEQLSQDAHITYSMKGGKYNVTVECLNISDRNLYDFYKVQRPGRTFNAKFRYFFSK